MLPVGGVPAVAVGFNQNWQLPASMPICRLIVLSRIAWVTAAAGTLLAVSSPGESIAALPTVACVSSATTFPLLSGEGWPHEQEAKCSPVTSNNDPISNLRPVRLPPGSHQPSGRSTGRSKCIGCTFPVEQC